MRAVTVEWSLGGCIDSEIFTKWEKWQWNDDQVGALTEKYYPSEGSDSETLIKWKVWQWNFDQVRAVSEMFPMWEQ